MFDELRDWCERTLATLNSRFDRSAAAARFAIDSESSRATTAEGALTTSIATEASTRASADTTLGSTITAETSRAMAAEALLAPLPLSPTKGTFQVSDGTNQQNFAAGTDGFALFALASQTLGLIWRAIAQADVTGLVAALALKSDTAHTHVGLFLSRTLLTSLVSATYTVPAGCHWIHIRFVGPGGAGGGVAGAVVQSCGAGGGGSGACCEAWIAVNPGDTFSYIMGTGGVVGAAGNNPGGAGSASSTFGTRTASAGNGGTGMAAGTTGVLAAGGTGGAVATNGDINGMGQSGDPGLRFVATSSQGGKGGATPFGGGGLAKSSNGNGNAATSPGGGGGGGNEIGSATNVTGGAGADGFGIVEEYS